MNAMTLERNLRWNMLERIWRDQKVVGYQGDGRETAFGYVFVSLSYLPWTGKLIQVLESGTRRRACGLSLDRVV